MSSFPSSTTSAGPGSTSNDASSVAASTLGLTTARINELASIVQRIEESDEKPYEAMDALVEISSLELSSSGDACRTYLMGAGIFDLLADLICICDEEWIGGEGGIVQVENNNGDESMQEEQTDTSVRASTTSSSSNLASSSSSLTTTQKCTLDLCSRALNAMGSMCTFSPFLLSVVEEDRCDDALDRSLVSKMGRSILRGVNRASFRMRGFGVSKEILHHPLLAATMFWLRWKRTTNADPGPTAAAPATASSSSSSSKLERLEEEIRAQAAFALSWFLAHPTLAAILYDAAVDEVLFFTLAEQAGIDLPTTASSTHVSSVPTVPCPSVTSSAPADRVSTHAENLRLYSCIGLQRLSKAGFSLFDDEFARFSFGSSAVGTNSPSAGGDGDQEQILFRLRLTLHLLHTVPSYNIRTILLHILHQAVTPNQLIDASSASAAAAATTISNPFGSGIVPPPATRTVRLPSAAISFLRSFRSSCGAIGSSSSAASSRHMSPALHPTHASTSTSRPPSATLTPASLSDTSHIAMEDSDDGDDGGDGDRSGSMSGTSDKTVQLQQLIDSILAAQDKLK